MAVKGTILKQHITNTILEIFGSNAFLCNDGKEIRICGTENGEDLQIKCTLTCAKVNVEAGSDVAIPGAVAAPTQAPPPSSYVAPDETEKKAVEDLIKKMQAGNVTSFKTN